MVSSGKRPFFQCCETDPAQYVGSSRVIYILLEERHTDQITFRAHTGCTFCGVIKKNVAVGGSNEAVLRATEMVMHAGKTEPVSRYALYAPKY